MRREDELAHASGHEWRAVGRVELLQDSRLLRHQRSQRVFTLHRAAGKQDSRDPVLPAGRRCCCNARSSVGIGTVSPIAPTARKCPSEWAGLNACTPNSQLEWGTVSLSAVSSPGSQEQHEAQGQCSGYRHSGGDSQTYKRRRLRRGRVGRRARWIYERPAQLISEGNHGSERIRVRAGRRRDCEHGGGGGVEPVPQREQCLRNERSNIRVGHVASFDSRHQKVHSHLCTMLGSPNKLLQAGRAARRRT